ncbi:MAG: hypothetical protein ACHRHE_19065, partial [Tepidisphaerales bacterium]
DAKPPILEYFNSQALQKANQRAGRLIARIAITIICVLGALFLIVILVPGLGVVPTERANRAKCARTLSCIGQALQLYANDNKCFPRTTYDPSKPLGNGFTGGGAANPFVPGGPAVNDPTAPLFLLAKYTGMSTEVLVCPSSSQVKDMFTVNGVTYTWQQRSNFTGPNNLSYSFTNMYPGTAAVSLGYQWSPRVTAAFAIAADRNDADPKAFVGVTSASSQAQQRKLNSHNHGQDGQNVLYNDGHVTWCPTAWVGAGNDNIYTSAKVDAAGNQLVPAASAPLWPDPQGPLDTVLVPRKGNGF